MKKHCSISIIITTPKIIKKHNNYILLDTNLCSILRVLLQFWKLKSKHESIKMFFDRLLVTKKSKNKFIVDLWHFCVFKVVFHKYLSSILRWRGEQDLKTQLKCENKKIKELKQKINKTVNKRNFK